MKPILSSITTTLATLLITATASAHGYCERYEKNETYLNAIRTVAQRMQYKPLELCTLSTLSDIYIESTSLIDDQTAESQPHTWVTLHYSEYSCQYFVKNSDQSVTKSNCYGTW